MTERKQPDEPRISRICRKCEYFENCILVPEMYNFTKRNCKIYQAYKQASESETRVLKLDSRGIEEKLKENIS